MVGAHDGFRDRRLTRRWDRWAPVIVLIAGVLLLSAVGRQQRPLLRAPLATALPLEILGRQGRDIVVPEDEARVAGFTDYALRLYADSAGAAAPAADGAAPEWASVYLGYYDMQTRGRTIHSPKNCLPGSGWEALSSRPADIRVGDRTITVNRYVLQNGEVRALVLYWYQGRGRVAHNEYLVKWDLLRDAALKRRTDEALVRIVVPILESEERSATIAEEIAAGLSVTLDLVLPS